MVLAYSLSLHRYWQQLQDSWSLLRFYPIDLLLLCIFLSRDPATIGLETNALMLEQKLETDKEGERKHSSYVLMSSRFLPLNHVSKQLMTNHLLVYCLSKCYNYFPYSLFICLSDSTRSE